GEQARDDEHAERDVRLGVALHRPNSPLNSREMGPIFLEEIRVKRQRIIEMRFDKLTTKLQEALAEAQSAALGNDNQYIEPPHLLNALLNDPGIAGLIAKAGGNTNALKKGLADALARLPKVEGT